MKESLGLCKAGEVVAGRVYSGGSSGAECFTVFLKIFCRNIVVSGKTGTFLVRKDNRNLRVTRYQGYHVHDKYEYLGRNLTLSKRQSCLMPGFPLVKLSYLSDHKDILLEVDNLGKYGARPGRLWNWQQTRDEKLGKYLGVTKNQI